MIIVSPKWFLNNDDKSWRQWLRIKLALRVRRLSFVIVASYPVELEEKARDGRTLQFNCSRLRQLANYKTNAAIPRKCARVLSNYVHHSPSFHRINPSSITEATAVMNLILVFNVNEHTTWRLIPFTFFVLSKDISLATKWLRIFSLGGNDKIRNHLVAKPIATVARHVIKNTYIPWNYL